MGSYLSRQNRNNEGEDLSSSSVYRYPPKNGNYFASHFIMGGERFEATQPEAYLFGENSDLNFLGCKPMPFPYPAPQPNEPTRPLRCLINIRKESLRFVRVKENQPSSSNQNLDEIGDPPVLKPTKYNIEFVFDTECRCAITIHYFCTEEVTPQGIQYSPRFPTMSSEPYHYKRGCNQLFQQSPHVFDPSKYSDSELTFSNYCSIISEYTGVGGGGGGVVAGNENEVFPVVIQCIAEEGEEPRQSHVLLAVVERANSNQGTLESVSYILKPLKQKLFVDGLVYLLQEIYGIENKNIIQTKAGGDDSDCEESGCECVICMSETRDTLILPCKHLCLCSACADSLRYQANNCPICRAPFRALLQIRAVRKILLSSHPSAQINELQQVSQDVPPGYESIPLIEALNGPTTNQIVHHHDTTKSSKSNRMHRNKSNSAGSLRHQQGAVEPVSITGVTAPSSPNITDPSLGRAETAPPGRHRRKHKIKNRPHTALPSTISLVDGSAESRSLLEAGGKGDGDADNARNGHKGSEGSVPSDGDGVTAPTVITVDQSTDTSLDRDNKEVDRTNDMVFHRRKVFPDNGGSKESAESGIVSDRPLEMIERKCSISKKPSQESHSSLPGTPGSTTSARSSAESFSSTGSGTRLLVNQPPSTGGGGQPCAAVTVVTIQSGTSLPRGTSIVPDTEEV